MDVDPLRGVNPKIIRQVLKEYIQISSAVLKLPVAPSGGATKCELKIAQAQLFRALLSPRRGKIVFKALDLLKVHQD